MKVHVYIYIYIGQRYAIQTVVSPFDAACSVTPYMHIRRRKKEPFILPDYRILFQTRSVCVR